MNERIIHGLCFVAVIFALGLLHYSMGLRENFESPSNNCPDRIIQKKDGIYLYWSNKAEIPGVNPIKFNNLEEYVEYAEWLKSQNIRCPILFYKESYSTQNKKILSVDPEMSIFPDINGEPPESKLIDGNRGPNTKYNKNQFPSFDPQNQYIGVTTPLDKIFNENNVSKSDNPMDPNWGGQKFTEEAVESGKFVGDDVYGEYN